MVLMSLLSPSDGSDATPFTDVSDVAPFTVLVSLLSPFDGSDVTSFIV
jgi:hypothetical protein